MSTHTEARRPNTAAEGFWLRIIYIVSVLICATVAFLILGPRPAGTAGALDVTALPGINASLNALTAVLLIVGWLLVRARRIDAHRNVMLVAFATSSAFLVSYVVYHWFKSGPRPYTGDYRALYLFILLSHIVLAAAIVPLALITLYRGYTMRVARHRRIAKVTLPLWLYVSVTGVAVYGMLYL
jgi:putative membrane protein